MLRFMALVFFICLNSTLTLPLSALSIGRDGSSYIQDEIEWQDVSYKDTDAGFTGTLPGSPRSGLIDGCAYCMSDYNGTLFQFNTEIGVTYKPPKKEKDFIRQLSEAFGDDASISSISLSQKNVKYCAELNFHDGDKIIRVYSSKNRLYFAIIEGEDLSLAPFVFDSFQITK